jgi:hypothetical protein
MCPEPTGESATWLDERQRGESQVRGIHSFLKGHIYWYAVEMARIDVKPKQVWQMYPGNAANK